VVVPGSLGQVGPDSPSFGLNQRGRRPYCPIVVDSDKTSSTGLLDDTERRRHSRSYVAGVAMLSHPKHHDTGACLIRNLSTSGALLLSSPPLAPGDTCRMVLTAPGLMGEAVDALVKRAGTASDGAAWAAVEFLELSEEMSHRLRRVVCLELIAPDTPAVLVVDGSEATLKATADQLAKHSRKAHLASTTVIAVDWLNERGRRIALALVGSNIVGTTPAGLLSYIGEEFPKIHRAELDRMPSEEMLRRLLDRIESEPAQHAPWRLSEFE
jgi:hypothetical protein